MADAVFNLPGCQLLIRVALYAGLINVHRDAYLPMTLRAIDGNPAVASPAFTLEGIATPLIPHALLWYICDLLTLF